MKLFQDYSIDSFYIWEDDLRLFDMGRTLVFKTDNDVCHAVKWKKKTTSSGVRVQSSAGLAGACGPMVARWMQRSIPLGYRGVRFASELGSMHLVGIVQSAFFSQRSAYDSKKDPADTINNMIVLCEVYDLFVKKHVVESKNFNLGAIFGMVCQEYGHYLLTCIYTVGQDENGRNILGGHAIGLRHDYQIFQVFEPNTGLFQYSDEKSFKEDLHQFLSVLPYSSTVAWALLEMDHRPR